MGTQEKPCGGRSDPAVVRLQKVEKVFANGTEALSAFDLDVREHEFLSLLGPSGCGKSTVLRLIAGLTRPSGGQLLWPGRERAASFGQGEEIGFVFQDPTLMPWATVFDNIFLPLRLDGLAKRLAGSRIATVIGMVGLDGFEQAYPRELSGGMKMRVSIARALVTEPSLLLLDEPFAALDEITRFKLNDDLLALWQDNQRTVVFVTHSVYESVYLSKRIVVMSPRPGRAVGEITVDTPYPRSEAFRASTPYHDHCRQVSAALKSALALGTIDA
ncbi:MAG: ABC transporter ATP-binding protein [Geminicoccaceae bacterium]